MGQLKLLGVLQDRRLETVEDFLKTIAERLRVKVQVVCTYLCEGYRLFGL